MAELGLAPRRDPGNETLVFDRNRVRRRVLPELRRLNPRAAEALAGFARRARCDDEALEAWAAAESARLVRSRARLHGSNAPGCVRCRRRSRRACCAERRRGWG